MPFPKLLGLLLAASACSQSQPSILFNLDAGAIQMYGDAGMGSCAQVTDLGCVNHVRYEFTTTTGELMSLCRPVGRKLASLCDLASLGGDVEVPADTRDITVSGVRVFPADSCEDTPQCKTRTIFSAHGDDTGLPVLLDVYLAHDEPCGPPEQYFPLPDGQSCGDVCAAGVVCSLDTGCLCLAN